jgi:4-amino-4-deoxy-L-arabinose transferase-like glycosyltransferase
LVPEGSAVTESPAAADRFSRLRKLLYIVLGSLYLFFLLGTLSSVPFHPDEATYIYMSRDLNRILATGPKAICWVAGNGTDPLQVERERDCPLARYAIGIARLVSGMPATPSNWNWSLDWNQNLARGAVPPDGLLLAARVPQALLLFLSVLLMAWIGGRLAGEAGAVSAAVLMALNSQMLLHARRAMSESELLFGMILVIAVVLTQRERSGRLFRGLFFPLLTGAALALAASAKYSGLLVAPPAVAGMFLGDHYDSPRDIFRRGVVRAGVMAFGFLLVFLALNPFFWCSPPAALTAVIAQRQSLLAAQVEALRTAAPGLVLDSFPLRLLAVPYQLYIAPLAFWDIPNYAQITAASQQAYLSNPLNTLTSAGILPLVLFVLSLGGGVLVFLRAARRGGDGRLRIVIVWFLSATGGIVVGVPILWQRYYLPLVPIAVIFSSVAITAIANDLSRRIRRSQPVSMEK